MRFALIVFILFSGGFLLYVFWPDGEIRHEPGILVAEAPLQRSLTNPASWEKDGYSIIPLAEFETNARVLHIKKYSRGRESDLSPVDLALGWGAMSDQKVLDQIDISQSGRWYEWRVKVFPVPQRIIETSSSNMHIIPVDDEVEEVLGSLRKGNIIQFSGYLVKVTASDGWHWTSSLTREDVVRGHVSWYW